MLTPLLKLYNNSAFDSDILLILSLLKPLLNLFLLISKTTNLLNINKPCLQSGISMYYNSFVIIVTKGQYVYWASWMIQTLANPGLIIRVHNKWMCKPVCVCVCICKDNSIYLWIHQVVMQSFQLNFAQVLQWNLVLDTVIFVTCIFNGHTRMIHQIS